jgi:uncharacterized protein YmfQ (DUF2313 family)
MPKKKMTSVNVSQRSVYIGDKYLLKAFKSFTFFEEIYEKAPTL